MSAQDGVTRVTSAGDLPTGPMVAYHVTALERASTVLETGLSSTASEEWRALDEYFESVAQATAVTEKPSKRANCSFAYTDITQGTKPTTQLSGYATIAIDLTRVENPVYVASYTQATRATRSLRQSKANWDARDGPNPLQLNGAAYQDAKAYWDTCEPYTADTELNPEPTYELLFDGGVSPTTFTHILD